MEETAVNNALDNNKRKTEKGLLAIIVSIIAIFLVVFIIVLTILRNLDNDDEKDKGNKNPTQNEFYWDIGATVRSTGISYSVNHFASLDNNYEVFCLDIYNGGNESYSINPYECVIIGPDGREYMYSYEVTYDYANHMDSSHKVNPGFSYYPIIAFQLPTGWKTNKFKFRIRYDYNKYLTLNMWSKNNTITIG